MNGAIFDATFNIFFKLKYAKLYDAVLATPMRPRDIAVGEIAWALMRGAFYSAAFLLVMLADGPGRVVVGAARAAGARADRVRVRGGRHGGCTTFMRSWQDFDYVSLAMLPMFLFSATFYPLSTYPDVAAVGGAAARRSTTRRRWCGS